MAQPVVGILALQGDFAAHEDVLTRHGVRVRQIRTAGDLVGTAALVLPGGESSVVWKLADAGSLLGPLRAALGSGIPVLATCAGLILLAREVTTPPQPSLGLLDVALARNGYGRQVHSAVHRLSGHRGFPDVEGVFIRAPRILATGPATQTLATWNGDPVLVRSGAILGACFHPELSEDHPLIDWFLAPLG